MAVDLETHRCRIGCFRHNNGTDVVKVTVTVNVTMASRIALIVLCLLLAALALVWFLWLHLEELLAFHISPSVKTAIGLQLSVPCFCRGKVGFADRLIGAVVFIRLLLLAAGVEPNPGPYCKIWEMSRLDRWSRLLEICVALLVAYSVKKFSLDAVSNMYFYQRTDLPNKDIDDTHVTFITCIQGLIASPENISTANRTCSFLLGNKGAHMTNGNPHEKGDVSLNPATLDLLERRVYKSVGFIRIHTSDETDELYATGTGFRVGECYLMTAYHVLRDKLENLIDRVAHIVNTQELSSEELSLMLNFESNKSSDTTEDIMKEFLNKNCVDTSLLMARLGDAVPDRFKSNETESWKKNCLVDFLDDNGEVITFSVDWKIMFGSEERDIVVVKLIDSTEELTMPEELSLAKTFETPDTAFIVRFKVTDKREVVLDQECTIFKDDDELQKAVIKAKEWWMSHFKREFDTKSYDGCMKAHDKNTGRIILRAAETFIEGSSGSPLVYFNSRGYVSVGAIYQGGFPAFYYRKQSLWNRRIEDITKGQIDKKVLFERCTTLEKVARLLEEHNKQDLKKVMFNQKTANRQTKREQFVSDVRGTRAYDIIFDNCKTTSDLQMTSLADNINKPKGPTEVMKNQVAVWEEEDKSVIETKATRFIHQKLLSSNIVTIVGSAGSGKSFAVHHSALKLQKDDYSLFVVDTCSEVFEYINRHQGKGKMLFIIDDPIGGDEIDNEKVREWRSKSEKVKACITGSTKLAVTIRKELFRNCTNLIFNKEHIDLHSTELCMLSIERTDFFFRKLAKMGLLSSNCPHILNLIRDCELENFPFLVHLFCTDKYFTLRPSELFNNPLGSFENRLKLMLETNKKQFISLVLLAVNDGKMKLSTFARLSNETTEEIQTAVTLLKSFDMTCSLSSVGDELDKLDGTYINKTKNHYEFRQSDMKRLVLYILWKELRGFSLEFYDTEFILKRCKLSRKSTNIYSLLDDDRHSCEESRYKLTIPEDSERCLSTKFILSVRDNNDNGSLVFSSDFCQDKTFLQIMYMEIKKMDVDEDFRNKILFQIMCNAFLQNFTDIIYQIREESFTFDSSSFTGITPLMACSYAGNEGITEVLLGKKCNTNLEFQGYTPLGLAVFNEQLNTVNLLLSGHCDVNAGYYIPLSIAALNGHEYLVNLLLENRADINKLDGDGDSVISNAISSSNLEVVKILLEHSAGVNIFGKNLFCMPPLFRACIEDNEVLIPILLDHGADVNIVNNMGNTALTMSIMMGQESTTRELLSANIDVNLKGEQWLSMTPLFAACLKGSVEVVTLLLGKNADVNKCNGFGLTPLTICVYIKQYEVMEVLLQYNADVNICSDDRTAMTPMTSASVTGYIHGIELLLQKDADINKFDGSGQTPLTRSIYHNDVTVIEFLLKHNADVNVCGDGEIALTPLTACCCIGAKDTVELLLSRNADINKCDGSGKSPLSWAVFKNHMNIVELLLKRNSDVNIYGVNTLAFTPLTAAISKGDNIKTIIGSNRSSCENGLNYMFKLLLKQDDNFMNFPLTASSNRNCAYILQLLLRYGADIDKPDGTGRTPLAWAIFENTADIVEFLLDKKADVNVCGLGKAATTPLTSAIETGSIENVKLMLDSGADIKKCDGSGTSPLERAITKNNSVVLNFLISIDVNVSSLGEENTLSPLTAAIYQGSVQTVKTLLQHNADINKYDGFGTTPLSVAITKKNVEISNILIENKANVNLGWKKREANTPLTHAVALELENIVEHLLAAGADINQLDALGRTPLTWAVLKNNYKLINILLAKKADVNISGNGIQAHSPLTIASNSVQIVYLLLKNNANVNQCDGRESTPLAMAIKNKNIDTIKLLIENKADVNKCSGTGESNTPLALACEFQLKDIVEYLLAEGADMNKLDGLGRTPLTWAVLKNNYMIIKLLLENNAEVNIRGQGVDAYSSLTMACLSRSVQNVRLLLKYKANVNICDGFGRTPLLVATRKKCIDIIKVLVEHKADMNSYGEGKFAYSPLFAAISIKSVDIIILLLSNNAKINSNDVYVNVPLTRAAFGNDIDNTYDNIFTNNRIAAQPLHYACAHGSKDVIQCLIDHGANINMQNNMGMTALIFCIIFKNIDALDVLLENNADVNCCEICNEGALLANTSLVFPEHRMNPETLAYFRTPLFLSILIKNINITEMLIENKADVNVFSKTWELFTPLTLATEVGCEEIIECLLKNGANINKANGSGKTALLLAIDSNKSDVVKVLLEHNAIVNIYEAHNKDLSPLSAACSKGSVEIVQLLLHNNADINEYDDSGRLPLMFAIANNHIDVVKLLKNNEAKLNRTNKTELSYASSLGLKDIVEFLLEIGQDIDQIDEGGHTPLSRAISGNHVEVVDILLQKKADINTCGRNGRSPLSAACSIGSEECVKILLSKHDIDINKYDGLGTTPLILAVYGSHIAVTKLLIRNNADMGICENTMQEFSPLTVATRLGNKDIVEYLIEEGADIDQFGNGCTALTIATIGNEVDIINFLLENAADVNLFLEGQQSLTPLSAAAHKNFVGIIELLFSYGAQPNYVDGYGNTPLAWAVMKNNIPAIKVLLRNNADVNICGNKFGAVTPLTAAINKGSNEILNLLYSCNTDIAFKESWKTKSNKLKNIPVLRRMSPTYWYLWFIPVLYICFLSFFYLHFSR